MKLSSGQSQVASRVITTTTLSAAAVCRALIVLDDLGEAMGGESSGGDVCGVVCGGDSMDVDVSICLSLSNEKKLLLPQSAETKELLRFCSLFFLC